MKQFIRENFKEGLIGVGRNNRSFKGWCIRLLGSWGNHTMMTALSNTGALGFNEQEPPRSQHTTYDEYEYLMNKKGYEVKIYEIIGVSDKEAEAMAHWYTKNYIGELYPETKNMLLLASKLVNLIADYGYMPPMRLTWCTQRVIDSVRAIKHTCLKGVHRKIMKMLWTPKTMEKRIDEGLLREVTNEHIREV